MSGVVEQEYYAALVELLEQCLKTFDELGRRKPKGCGWHVPPLHLSDGFLGLRDPTAQFLGARQTCVSAGCVQAQHDLEQ
jgi:hypothetical protein